MNRTLTLLVASAVLAAASIAPAIAQVIPTNQAILQVQATVDNNCDVITQPATLFMTYNTIQNTGTQGTSSFTWACTNGVKIVVTPTSPNTGGPSNTDWIAKGPPSGQNLAGLNYLLYNDYYCATNQLTNGTSEFLGVTDGTTQIYNICGVPDTTTQQNLPAGTYLDTVTFTFNFKP